MLARCGGERRLLGGPARSERLSRRGQKLLMHVAELFGLVAAANALSARLVTDLVSGTRAHTPSVSVMPATMSAEGSKSSLSVLRHVGHPVIKTKATSLGLRPQDVSPYS